MQVTLKNDKGMTKSKGRFFMDYVVFRFFHSFVQK